MPRHLCIDFGNTLIKAAIFEERQIVQQIQLTYEEGLDALEHLRQQQNSTVGNYSTVRTLSDEISQWLDRHSLHRVTSMTSSPIQVDYETPETLGVDRFCNAIAGWIMCKPNPVLIVDAGTCITYDYVNDQGQYLGGAISPGYRMRLQAMHHFTNQLPLVDSSESMPEIGKSTTGSMSLGARRGTIEEVRGFIHYFQQTQPHLKVILTGGDQSIFEQHLENAIFAAQNLVLTGLNEVLLHSEKD